MTERLLHHEPITSRKIGEAYSVPTNQLRSSGTWLTGNY